MRATIRLSLFIILLLGSVGYGQMNYEMEKTTGTYIPLTGGKNFKYIGNPAFLNDNISQATPVGFSFNYNNQVFDTFQVTTNGFIRMGSGLTDAGNPNSLNRLTRRLIAPLWDDILAQDTNSIQYLTTGTAPNRVLSVDFRTVKWSTATGFSSFMIKLYESTNVIEFIYGTMNPGTTVSLTIGISSNQPVTSSGSATGTNSFLSINLGADSLNPSYMQSMTLSYDNISKLPLPGTLLRFTQNNTPIAPGTYTVGATGNFKTISSMATALNSRGVAGPLTFLIQDGTYDDFLHLSLISGTSQTNTVTIKPATGANVILSPANGSFSTNQIGPFTGESIIRCSGINWVTIDGLNMVQNPLNLNATTRYENGLCVTSSSIALSGVTFLTGSKCNTFKNFNIDMKISLVPTTNSNTTGIMMGGFSSNTPDSTAACSYNTFQNFEIRDFGSIGVYMIGSHQSAPDIANKFTATSGRNYIGDLSLTATTGILSAYGFFVYKQKDLTIEKTDISNILISTFNGGSCYGINLNNIDDTTFANQGNIVLKNNRIFNLKVNPSETSPNTAGGIMAGILINRVKPGSNVQIVGNEIFNLESNLPSNQNRIQGIIYNAGYPGEIIPGTIANNVISDLKVSTSASPSITIWGLELKTSTNSNGISNVTVANNTFFLNHYPAPFATAIHSSCLMIGNMGTGKIDLKNNIFINNSNVGYGGAGLATAIRADLVSNFLSLTEESNNNLYNYTIPDLNRGISVVANVINKTLTDHIISLYKFKKSGAIDYNAIFATVPFVNPTTSPFNLRVSTSTPTQASNAGVSVAGVTTDLDGNSRSLTTPDIGAFEFNGVDDDKTSPYISVTKLPALLPMGQMLTFKAAFRDRNGVASSGNAPKAYYRTTKSQTYLTQSGVVSSPDSLSFTIDPTLVNAGASDTLVVYVAAQDNNSTPNGGSYPYGGSGVNPPGSTPPQTLFEVPIQGSPLSGNYTIGLSAFNRITGKNLYFSSSKSGDQLLMEGGSPYSGALFATSPTEAVYATLSQAVNDFNVRGISGNTNFILLDTGYIINSSLTLSTISDYVPNANAKLKITPGAGVSTTIRTNSTDPVFVLRNSFIEINGSNTPNGTTRNLSIKNLGTNSNSGGIYARGREYNFSNLYISCADSSVGFGVILDSVKSSSLMNNSFKSATKGVIIQNYSDSILVTKNEIGSNSPGSRISIDGIYISESTNYTISENKIFGIRSNGSSAVNGINIVNSTAGSNPVKGDIDRNHIYSIKHLGQDNSAFAATGIWLATNNSNSQLSVTNNVISDIFTGARNSIFSSTRGIYVQNGGNIAIVNNSIRLSGEITYTQTSASYSGCIVILSTGSTSITVMNNILSNRLSNPAGINGTHFAVWSATAANFSIYNFNLLDVAPNSGRLMYLAGSFVNNRDSIFTITGKGNYTFVNQPAFLDTLTLEIDNINPEAANTDGFGYPTGVAVDFLGNPRSTAIASGPVDLGAYEYNLDVEPPLVQPNPPPAPGDLSTYTLNGIVIAQIQWGNTGTLPSNMALAFYSEDPQLTEGIKYFYGKWKLVPTGGADYNYTFRTRLLPNSVGAGDTNSLKAVTFTDKWYLTGNSTKIPGYISTAGLTTGGFYSLVDAQFIAPVPISPTNNQFVNSTVTLNWSKVNFLIPVLEQKEGGKLDRDGAPTTYNLQVSSDSLFTSPVAYSATDTFFTVTGTPEGSRRFWRVGVTEKNFFTGFSTPSTMNVKLNQPSNLAAISNQYNRVTLTWNDNSASETGVVLERKSGDSTSANNYSVVATLPANSVAYLDTTVSGSTGYTYRVKMLNTDSYSDYSNQAQVVTLVPVELTSFSADFNGEKVVLYWETATETNNHGYEIERKAGKEWQSAGFVKGVGTVTTTTPYTFSDNLRFINFNGKMFYRLKQIDNDGTVSFSREVSVEVDLTPKQYALYQNYPNPFNPSTIIKYALPSQSRVTVKVYNLAGEMIRELFNGNESAGYHDITVSSTGLASGIYFYVIDASAESGGKNFREVKKMVLMK